MTISCLIGWKGHLRQMWSRHKGLEKVSQNTNFKILSHPDPNPKSRSASSRIPDGSECRDISALKTKDDFVCQSRVGDDNDCFRIGLSVQAVGELDHILATFVLGVDDEGIWVGAEDCIEDFFAVRFSCNCCSFSRRSLIRWRKSVLICARR